MLSLHSPKLPETIFYISVAQKPSRWTEGNNHANISLLSESAERPLAFPASKCETL